MIDVTDGEAALKAGQFMKLSIANPVAAPYGTAAVETMKALGVYDALQPKIVQGNSIAQAFQFVDTQERGGRLRRAFAALSASRAGTRWEVPPTLYSPIRQDAVLLKTGADSEASKAFLDFLKGPEARAIIERFGYCAEVEARGAAAFRPKIWVPIQLTLELAAITTLSLLIVATPLAWWLMRAQRHGSKRPPLPSSRCRWCCRRRCSASIS